MPAFFGPEGPGRIDITRLMSSDTQQLMAEAAQFAARRGDTGLDALHILHVAAVKEPGARHGQASGWGPRRSRRTRRRNCPVVRKPVSISPTVTARTSDAARRTPDRARTRTTYIDPEHIFLSLVSNGDSTTGASSRPHGVTPESMQSASERECCGAAAGVGHPDARKYGTDLTERPAPAASARSSDVATRSSRPSRSWRAGPRTTRFWSVRPASARPPSSRVWRSASSTETSGRCAGGQEDRPAGPGRHAVRNPLPRRLRGAADQGGRRDRRQDGRLIVFIDELHTIVGAGAAARCMDAGNILKPKLARGDLRIVGATTLDEYRKHIEKDSRARAAVPSR